MASNTIRTTHTVTKPETSTLNIIAGYVNTIQNHFLASWYLRWRSVHVSGELWEDLPKHLPAFDSFGLPFIPRMRFCRPVIRPDKADVLQCTVSCFPNRLLPVLMLITHNMLNTERYLVSQFLLHLSMFSCQIAFLYHFRKIHLVLPVSGIPVIIVFKQA